LCKTVPCRASDSVYPDACSIRDNTQLARILTRVREMRARLEASSCLAGPAPNKFFICGEMQLDHVAGRLIGQFQGLLVELFGREGDEPFRLAEELCADRGERLSQMILHARSAQ